MTTPLSKQAVFWIMAAPKGEKRTQAAAAKKFGVAQGNISTAMKRWVAESIRPDARRRNRSV
ncbi:MAG: hypothetical protein WC736_14745 [Gallionella sp.]|jgi:hypothetical protein